MNKQVSLLANDNVLTVTCYECSHLIYRVHLLGAVMNLNSNFFTVALCCLRFIVIFSHHSSFVFTSYISFGVPTPLVSCLALKVHFFALVLQCALSKLC